MEYEKNHLDKQFILDDSLEKETLNIIENLIGKKLNIEINNQRELVEFLNNPGLFLNDQEMIDDIKNLKELIVEMSSIYHA